VRLESAEVLPYPRLACHLRMVYAGMATEGGPGPASTADGRHGHGSQILPSMANHRGVPSTHYLDADAPILQRRGGIVGRGIPSSPSP
jgi:hypothetical protein